MQVLLVEDHEASRNSLKRLLERRGHEVTAVGTAEEAEQALAVQQFMFVILDWMLPGKSGLDLCRQLRTRPDGDDLFILLVTARSRADDLEQALAAGANDYLTKPFDSDLLSVRLRIAERRIESLIERQQARVQLQDMLRRMTDILEKTNDGFFAVDCDWRFTFVNPEAERIFERPRQELIGKNLWTEFPALNQETFAQNYRRAMSEQVAVRFEAKDTAGSAWLEVHAYPSNDGGISVFLRDVTDRKRNEEQRLTTGKLESLGTLAGGIAHDLNNVLTVISGNISLAQIELPRDAATLHGVLDRAGEAARHAAHLSNQLLTFSKGGTPRKQVTPVAMLLGEAAEFSLHGSNLHAQMDLSADLWRAEVDREQIKQVVNALIINARQAMPQGGILRLSACNVELDAAFDQVLGPGRYLKVAISDQGCGIKPELRTKIFDPYFTTKPGGSGLGLAISYSIIKKHGGMLHLESSSAKGSTFAFYLPATNGKPDSVKRPAEQIPFRFAQQRILVMDDEAAVRELISELLQTFGFEVAAVPDGLAAVKAYEKAMHAGKKFQAVILDATIRGGMGGVATIERLRSLDPNVTALVCSGYSDEAALSEFLTYGFRSALPKPFTRFELAEALQRAFDAAAQAEIENLQAAV